MVTSLPDCSFAMGIALTGSECLTAAPPPSLHTHTTLIDLGLTLKPPSDWFVTHHWSPALGCDHPSHSNSVSSAPGPVTLALRKPKDLVFLFWWPVLCLPHINTVLTVDVRWI